MREIAAGLRAIKPIKESCRLWAAHTLTAETAHAARCRHFPCCAITARSPRYLTIARAWEDTAGTDAVSRFMEPAVAWGAGAAGEGTSAGASSS